MPIRPPLTQGPLHPPPTPRPREGILKTQVNTECKNGNGHCATELECMDIFSTYCNVHDVNLSKARNLPRIMVNESEC